MVIKSKQHIQESKIALEQVISDVKEVLESMDEEALNILEGPGKWSILQCLKHMSLSIRVYVENIENVLASKKHNTPSQEFKSHWKGDMFTKMISPQSGGEIKSKMKTFKTMNPVNKLDSNKTIEEFFFLHQQFIGLIENSENYNLNRVKVNTALGPLVKLRLGDAFRFIIGHAQRHVLQLKRIRVAIHKTAA